MYFFLFLVFLVVVFDDVVWEDVGFDERFAFFKAISVAKKSMTGNYQ
jgi:hypothetical protein